MAWGFFLLFVIVFTFEIGGCEEDMDLFWILCVIDFSDMVIFVRVRLGNADELFDLGEERR